MIMVMVMIVIVITFIIIVFMKCYTTSLVMIIMITFAMHMGMLSFVMMIITPVTCFTTIFSSMYLLVTMPSTFWLCSRLVFGITIQFTSVHVRASVFKSIFLLFPNTVVRIIFTLNITVVACDWTVGCQK